MIETIGPRRHRKGWFELSSALPVVAALPFRCGWNALIAGWERQQCLVAEAGRSAHIASLSQARAPVPRPAARLRAVVFREGCRRGVSPTFSETQDRSWPRATSETERSDAAVFHHEAELAVGSAAGEGVPPPEAMRHDWLQVRHRFPARGVGGIRSRTRVRHVGPWDLDHDRRRNSRPARAARQALGRRGARPITRERRPRGRHDDRRCVVDLTLEPGTCLRSRQPRARPDQDGETLRKRSRNRRFKVSVASGSSARVKGVITCSNMGRNHVAKVTGLGAPQWRGARS